MSVRLPDLSQAVSREKEGQRANEERRLKKKLFEGRNSTQIFHKLLTKRG